MYHPRGSSYELCSIGVISLKALMKVNESHHGILQMHSVRDGNLFATIEYNITLTSKMCDALNLQRQKLTAINRLPSEDQEPISHSIFNQLIIDIQRSSNLDKLVKGDYAPSTFVCYELYDCDTWRTSTIPNNANPEYNSVKSWLLPTGINLHRTFRHSNLTVFIIEDQGNGGSERQIGYINIALYPLIHNKKISGAFPLLSINGMPSEASIDISIYWKCSCYPPQEHLLDNKVQCI
ncbi:unnamed protein product [Thelazia callipaeda]|uniref:C2 domain-containing protein n=1 Tax=Thelazia callipaeda TaxID=103827 RepID=A0A0N5CYA5_THECL|nr:unnamed protein product [Thelazia callipaeda]